MINKLEDKNSDPYKNRQLFIFVAHRKLVQILPFILQL